MPFPVWPKTRPKILPEDLAKGRANLSASGATRITATLNYKGKYEPDFPMVTVVGATLGHIMTPARLDALGLVAPVEVEQAAEIVPLHPGAGGAKLPQHLRADRLENPVQIRTRRKGGYRSRSPRSRLMSEAAWQKPGMGVTFAPLTFNRLLAKALTTGNSPRFAPPSGNLYILEDELVCSNRIRSFGQRWM